MSKKDYPQSRYDLPTAVVMHYGVPETYSPNDKLEKLRQKLSEETNVTVTQSKTDVEVKAEKIRQTAEKLAEAMKIASAANDEVFKLRAELRELIKS